MTSREISALVELRHDNVKRTIETLAARGVITLPQSEEVPNDGPGPKSISVFRVAKRDSQPKRFARPTRPRYGRSSHMRLFPLSERTRRTHDVAAGVRVNAQADAQRCRVNVAVQNRDAIPLTQAGTFTGGAL